VYNGEAKKGALFFCLVQILVPLLSLIMLLGPPLAPVNIIGPILIGFCIYLYIIIDAIRTARRLGNTYQRKDYNKWYVYLGAYVIAWFVINPAVDHLSRQGLVQAFRVPSGAMEETLLIGDHFLVNRFLYRFSPPKRFDIIVFKYPWEDQRDFIKRIVALPGDWVEVRNRQVYVNDQPLKEPYARYTALRSHPDNFGPLVVPKQGDQVEIRQDQRLYLNGKPVPMPSGRFYPRDHGAAMTGFEVFYGALFPAGMTLQKPTGPIVVQHDYYFTLGDSRDNSKDSRYWGFVRRNRIKGKTTVIYWSWNRQAAGWGRIRWERIGQSVQ
jgi:signal peptidase I